jgi:RNA polymerase sigma-70 factor (ECF subfamily)
VTRPDAGDAAHALAEATRTSRRRILAQLTRRHGLACLAQAEDAWGTASERALQRWAQDGVPADPAAWLHRVAQHALIDGLRRGRFETALESEPADDDGSEADAAAAAATPAAAASSGRFAGELDDDELALVFAACHPALPPLSQVALALRALSGLPLALLAEVLLCSEAALAQRLARARDALAGETLAIPAGAELAARREAVLTTLWLAFHLGQRARTWGVPGAEADGPAAPGCEADRPAAPGSDAPAVCWEAIRLARALAAHPRAAHADADALAAQLLFHGARLTGRWGAEGEIVPLPGQPRDRWDAGMLRLGFVHLQRAQRAGQLSRWHLLAGIAGEHAIAPSYAATDWGAILGYYALLLRLDRTAAPRLGHAIAMAEAGNTAAARQQLQALLDKGPAALRAHTLAALARTHEREGDAIAAQRLLLAAAEAARHPADAADLRRRAAALVKP